MTDEEYVRFLTALAQKHLRPKSPELVQGNAEANLPRFSKASRLLKIVWDHDDPVLLKHLVGELQGLRPIKLAAYNMKESGMLDALDEAPKVTLGELRYSVIPQEDPDYLRRAGFHAHDVELLVALAIQGAHTLASSGKLPSDVVEEAHAALETALQSLQDGSKTLAPKKERKILSGVGKLLAGAITGVGNVLLLTGTLAAPNPGIGFAAMASGALAVGSFFQGIGELK